MDALAGLARPQPVVPFAMVALRSNPPMKVPQLTPLAFSRSPILGPPSCTVVPAEQTSPAGSRSPTSVPGPALIGTTLVEGALGVAG